MTYQEAVKKTYEALKKENLLSINLQNVSSAKLKEELISIIPKINIQQERKLLSCFVDNYADEVDLIKKMVKLDNDVFKPLVLFINGKSKTTDDKNIELLALLINFRPRPENFKIHSYEKIYQDILQEIQNRSFKCHFDYSQNHVNNLNHLSSTTENKNIQVGAINIEAKVVELKTGSVLVPLSNEEYNVKSKSKSRSINYLKLSQYGILPTLLSLFGWIIFSKEPIFGSSFGITMKSEQCMVWDEDQYKPIHCNETMFSTQVIPLNKDLLENYKKIVCWDKLGKDAIGTVWYFKIKNEVQLFSAPGNHPEYRQMYGRPLTKYMYNKYVVNKSIYNPCSNHKH